MEILVNLHVLLPIYIEVLELWGNQVDRLVWFFCPSFIVKKWIPMFKDWLLNCISYLWECIPPQTTKCDELFNARKKTALHHAINVQEMAGPYLKVRQKKLKPFSPKLLLSARLFFQWQGHFLQEARKFTQPYINQVAKMTRSLVKRVVAAWDWWWSGGRAGIEEIIE